jgi:hypothetical protein
VCQLFQFCLVVFVLENNSMSSNNLIAAVIVIIIKSIQGRVYEQVLSTSQEEGAGILQSA